MEFRPLIQEDLPFLLEVRNECRGFLHDDRAFTLEECRSWFQNIGPDFLLMVMEDEPMGYIRLAHHDPAGRSIQVGMDLHPRFRGRGLARQAYGHLWEWLKEHRQVSRVSLEVLSHNERALRLYQSLGFQETGRIHAHSRRNGLLVDSIQMERAL